MAETTPLKRAGVYARVSTTDKGQETEVQLAPLRALVESRGWTLAQTYIDEGVSGIKTSRPGLDALMADVRSGVVDVVVVWRFDRFARSSKHLLSALEEFRERKVDFVSQQENIDTSTAMGRLVFTFLAAIAEFEREIIKERVRAGMAFARSCGQHLGRPMKALDLRPALAMLQMGHSLEETAQAVKIPRRTLRRRLEAEGKWPLVKLAPEGS